MKILYCWPSAEYSTFDAGTGYRDALRQTPGINLEEWLLYNRIKIMYRALGLEQTKENLAVVSYQACKMIVGDVIESEPEWVVIISAMAFHPNALLLLKKLHVKIAVLFTECPYDDGDLAYFAQFCDVVFANDLFSAEKFGWVYLPCAYDQLVHCPGPSAAPQHDAVIVGTGWDERVVLFDSMNWTDIDLGMYGFWPQLALDAESINMRDAIGMTPNDHARVHLGQYVDEPTTNKETVELYRNAKICINDHRKHPDALSCNPRVFEVLATGGGLLLTDWRDDLQRILGPQADLFVFEGPKDLEEKIRYYLAHEDQRLALVEYGRERVRGETFDERTKVLLEHLSTFGTKKAREPALVSSK